MNAARLAFARSRASGATKAQALETAQAVADAWQLKGGQHGSRGNRSVGRLQPTTGRLPAALRQIVGGGPLDGREAAGRPGARRKAQADELAQAAQTEAAWKADRLASLNRQLTRISLKMEKSNRQRKKLQPAKKAILNKITALLK